jgi:hypothetical protein
MNRLPPRIFSQLIECFESASARLAVNLASPLVSISGFFAPIKLSITWRSRFPATFRVCTSKSRLELLARFPEAAFGNPDCHRRRKSFR